MSGFQSNAKWPAPVRRGNTGNTSSDSHDSHDFAAAICARLREQGFGGERKIFPLRTWVSPVGQPEIVLARDDVERIRSYFPNARAKGLQPWWYEIYSEKTVIGSGNSVRAAYADAALNVEKVYASV